MVAWRNSDAPPRESTYALRNHRVAPQPSVPSISPWQVHASTGSKSSFQRRAFRHHPDQANRHSVRKAGQHFFEQAFRGVCVGIERERYRPERSEEHTSELQSLMRNPYDVFCLKKKYKSNKIIT